MTRFQIQAVLRRAKPKGPLVLAGIVLDNRFFPREAGDRDELVLTKGLVALAPLTSVEAPGADEAAAIGIADADKTWDGPGSPGPTSEQSP